MTTHLYNVIKLSHFSSPVKRGEGVNSRLSAMAEVAIFQDVTNVNAQGENGAVALSRIATRGKHLKTENVSRAGARISLGKVKGKAEEKFSRFFDQNVALLAKSGKLLYAHLYDKRVDK